VTDETIINANTGIIVQETPQEDALITKLRDFKQDDEAFAYAEAVRGGRTCQENLDKARWVIGDLACFVETEYGEHKLADFADDINVALERVEEYRTMCRFWTYSARAEFSEFERLSYSHLRVAKAFKSLDMARLFLFECVTNAWTVRDARMEANRRLGKEPEQKEAKAGTKAKPAPVLTAEGFVTNLSDRTVTLNATSTRALVRGKRYRVEFYLPEDSEDEGED
jgi:hypothetical protein